VRIFKDFNEVKAAVRTEVGVSDWVEVTRNALSSLLRRLLLTLTLAPGIVRSVMGVKGIKNTQNYGAKSYSLLDPSARGLKAARWG
jgi:hypothetical protein